MKGNIDWNKTLEEIYKLSQEGYDLAETLRTDYDSSVNDWVKMLRYADRIGRFRYQTFVYLDFCNLIVRMENEKDRFETQKVAQYHVKNYKDEIDDIIEVSRCWKMEDYRCRKYQERMEKLLLYIQEFVTEE